MQENILTNEYPVYIPKIMDHSLTDLENLEFAFMEAHYLKYREGVYLKLKDISKNLIIDPATYRFYVKSSREATYFKKLPYWIEENIVDLFGDFDVRNNNFVIPCIDFQVNNGASIIISPYFYANDSNSNNFNLNLTMISDSIEYLSSKKLGNPLFACITLGCNELENTTNLIYIADRYVSDYEKTITGYFILIEKFDSKKCNINQLIGLVKLVKLLLSYKKLVFIKHIGGFGEILCTLGASGFISGLDSGETFSLEGLEQVSRGRNNIERLYIPELMTHIKIEEAIKINYKCHCSYCKGSFPQTPKDRKIHYYFSKIQKMNALKNIKMVDRVSYMNIFLENAIKFANLNNAKYGTLIETRYLLNWNNVLLNSQDISLEEDKELTDLLEAIDANN